MINIDYPNILNLLKPYLVSGRTESASFLVWYLENYYRLDLQDAIDVICDQSGDKGVDGVYINEANGTIDIFQTKIIQNPSKTIGDTALKEFYGTLSQFETKESLKNLIDTGGSAQVVNLIKRLNIYALYDQYKIRGIFVSNVNIDTNGEAYLNTTPQIVFKGKKDLETSYISNSRDVPQNIVADFDVEGLSIARHYVDTDTVAVIVSVKANELVKIPGIADQSVFAYNVRGALGSTNVNKDIVKSIKDKSLHKQFPLFHNGITIVANKIEETSDKLKIDTFFVVNGCQSLMALYNNRKDLTDDLRILTKFVQVSIDSDLSKTITHFSNNQNGVKARDFKSNNTIQVRLQNEIRTRYGSEYFYEIKRGEIPGSLKVISNENSGILLMSFDLKEPWNTHRKYQVFDEKYTEIFGRPEVTADRIVMLNLIDNAISLKLSSVNNQLVAKYVLTRFVLLYMLRQIFDNDLTGQQLLKAPEDFVYEINNRNHFIDVISKIIDDIIVDFNGEVDNLGEDFDYRSKLRDEAWVKNLSKEIVGSYLKLVKRGRIDSFELDWKKVII